MLSLKLEYDVPEDRSLHIQLPQAVKPGKHELVLVVDTGGNSIEIASGESLTKGGCQPSFYDLTQDFCGCITGVPADLSVNPEYLEGFGK
jgi:hypothetical protein